MPWEVVSWIWVEISVVSKRLFEICAKKKKYGFQATVKDYNGVWSSELLRTLLMEFISLCWSVVRLGSLLGWQVMLIRNFIYPLDITRFYFTVGLKQWVDMFHFRFTEMCTETVRLIGKMNRHIWALFLKVYAAWICIAIWHNKKWSKKSQKFHLYIYI